MNKQSVYKDNRIITNRSHSDIQCFYIEILQPFVTSSSNSQESELIERNVYLYKWPAPFWRILGEDKAEHITHHRDVWLCNKEQMFNLE